MRLRRWLVPTGILAVMPACGSGTLEPGTITIALLAPPAVTNDGVVELTGLVTRTPAASGTTIIVTATKSGQVESDTADASGAFLLTITLTINAENRILVSATDESGSTATPETVVVLHDGQAPRVSASTPANQADGVTPATITVQFDEPVVDGSAAIAVTQQGAAVTGNATLSADSRTLTFTPSAALAINAVYEWTISGAEDSVGNSQLVPTRQCFVTGGSGIFMVADAADDVYATAAPPSALVPPDLLQIRMARADGMIRTALQFDTPRSLSATANNTLFAALDFDVDADSATGFTTVKDFVFTPNSILPHSGTGAEYTIWIIPQATASDSSFAGTYSEPLGGTVTFVFVPSLCGPLVGIVVPETALGGDVGSSRFVGYVDALAESEGYADPAPDVGFYTAVLTAATVRGAPSAFGHGREGSSFTHRFLGRSRLPTLRR